MNGHGAEITTFEGLKESEKLYPPQAAFIEHDSFQCGFALQTNCSALDVWLSQQHSFFSVCP
jgi:aerobic-type carbon monoxide dehydrogenase small subunit (CoxS/CutS family)